MPSGPQEPKGVIQQRCESVQSQAALGIKSVVLPEKPTGASNCLVILVVEDEALVRAAIAEHLRDCDCFVLEADGAEQAAAIRRSGRDVDVLLTDINLRGGTGWDVAEEFRAAQPDVGVVYVSGNSVDRDRCVSGSLFFHKPYINADILHACTIVSHRSAATKGT